MSLRITIEEILGSELLVVSRHCCLDLHGWKEAHGRFLAIGIFRLFKALGAIVIAALFFNVLGYFSLSYDLGFGDVLNVNQVREYWIRVLLLSFIGLINTAAAILLSLAGIVLAACYFGVLHIGGYRRD